MLGLPNGEPPSPRAEGDVGRGFYLTEYTRSIPCKKGDNHFTSLLGVTVPSAMVLSVLGLANIQRPAPAPNTCLKWILISSVLVLLTQIVVIITVELSNQEFLAVGR